MIEYAIGIVEHDEERRAFMCQTIGDIFKVTAFASGKELLDYLSEKQCDLVLIDFNISDMSALDLQQAVNKDYPDVGTIMITAIDRSRCVIESMKKRAMDYIYRTDDPERFRSDVCKTVRHLIDERKRHFTEHALKETGLYQLIQDVYEHRTVSVDEIKQEIEKLKNMKKTK